MNRILLSLIGFVLLGSLLFTPAAFAQQNFDVQKAITNGDHPALADYYQNQAQRYRELAEQHQQMEKEYRISPGGKIKGSRGGYHCRKLRSLALKSAKTYESLAEAEKKLASESKPLMI